MRSEGPEVRVGEEGQPVPEGAEQELRAKNAELESFVYSVSHDLKAPLVAIQGLAEIIVEDYGPRLDEEGRHLLGRLQANVAQMERLILDLLELSRIGRESRKPEAVDVGEVVDTFVAEMGTALRARGVEIVRGQTGVLWGVRTRVEQVMSNLLGNAVKYMGEQPTPRIEVGMRPDGAFALCHVKDNGIGIDPVHHERIFDVFQRLQEIEVEGTGIGLAIAKKVVAKAGGRLWVESAKGQGATFFFTWPARADGGAT